MTNETAYNTVMGTDPEPQGHAPGAQIPGARRQGFTSDRPREAPTRPDVLGSAKWHDAALEQHPDNRFFNDASASHLNVKLIVDGLEETAANRDPRLTPAAHNEQLALRAERAAASIESSFKRRAMTNFAAINEKAAAIDERLGIDTEHRHASEIRAKLAGMDDDARRSAMHAAAQRGDADVMSAVRGAPAFLLGMSEDELARCVDAFRRSHASAEMAELDAVKRSAEKLEDAYCEAPAFIRKHYIDRSHAPAAERADRTAQRISDVLGNL